MHNVGSLLILSCILELSYGRGEGHAAATAMHMQVAATQYTSEGHWAAPPELGVCTWVLSSGRAWPAVEPWGIETSPWASGGSSDALPAVPQHQDARGRHRVADDCCVSLADIPHESEHTGFGRLGQCGLLRERERALSQLSRRVPSPSPLHCLYFIALTLLSLTTLLQTLYSIHPP